MTGIGGDVRAGGRLAAALGAWSFTGTPESWELTGDTVATDAYWLERPDARFRLTLHVGTRRWRWDGVGVAADGSAPPRLTITGTGEAEKY
jgi:hypothetical protein